MSLHRGTGGRKKEVYHEGDVKETERDHVVAFQVSVGWQQGHGNEHWFSHEQWRMVTYEQQKLGLSTYYDKRWVLEHGIHTGPIEFHI